VTLDLTPLTVTVTANLQKSVEEFPVSLVNLLEPGTSAVYG